MGETSGVCFGEAGSELGELLPCLCCCGEIMPSEKVAGYLGN